MLESETLPHLLYIKYIVMLKNGEKQTSSKYERSKIVLDWADIYAHVLTYTMGLRDNITTPCLWGCKRAKIVENRLKGSLSLSLLRILLERSRFVIWGSFYIHRFFSNSLTWCGKIYSNVDSHYHLVRLLQRTPHEAAFKYYRQSSLSNHN